MCDVVEAKRNNRNTSVAGEEAALWTLDSNTLLK